MNTFNLTSDAGTAFLIAMNAVKTRWCWRKDLAGFRGLTDKERAGFLLVLEWFENFRMRFGLPAGREAAKTFWKSDVLGEGREREPWQLEQWTAAIQWYLDWLAACAEAGADHRSLPERLRAAVHSACSRRGLARRTKLCYGAWAARYAVFGKEQRKVMQVEVATAFLTSVVEDEDCAYSTQKQALNAVAFFFKYVLGVEEPVFNVKLRKTGTRIPVVLSKPETHQVFEKLEEVKGCYGLAARLQYGAGLRLSELVRLRIKDVDPASLHYAGTSLAKSGVLRSHVRNDFLNTVRRMLPWIHREMRLQLQPARECGLPWPALLPDCAA